MKKHIAILDVETNRKRKTFDIGLLIADTHGNEIFSRGYIIKEYFKDTLYYEKHRKLYEKRLLDDNYPSFLVTAEKALKQVQRIFEHYKIKEVYAYNAGFDARKIQELAKDHNTKNPLDDKKIECLWTWACQTIFQQKRFADFCIDNNLLTEKGNYKTSAEVAYAYINNKPKFEEEHTGLEDCKIEYEIYLHCKKQNKFRLRGIIHNPWILVLTPEQIEKLPKQFQTMRVKFDDQVEKAKVLAERLQKPLQVVTE